MSFTRKKENFTCKSCGQKVIGNGYTNHCPNCLCSLHIDNQPGDRANACGGLMPAIALETKHGKQILIHKCQKCGEEKRNKTNSEDNIEEILKLLPKF